MGKIVAVTLVDIARSAKVSPATVSLALRSHPSIPASTRARIARHAQKLGYQPHGSISELMGSVRAQRPLLERPVIAALTFWPDERAWQANPYWQAIFLGAQRRAASLGFQLEEFWLNAPGMTPARLDRILRSRNIQPVVVMPFQRPIRIDLRWENYAAVAIGYLLESPRLHRVTHSHYDAVLLGLHEAAARGYRRVGLVVHRPTHERIGRRWLGAFLAHQETLTGLTGNAVLLLNQPDRDVFCRWFTQFRPDAILCDGWLGVVAWIQSLGYKVPGDIGVIALARAPSRPEYSGVEQFSDLVGTSAIEIVVGQFQRNERAASGYPRDTLVPCEWFEGSTVRPRLSPAAPEARQGNRGSRRVFAPG